MNNNLMHGYLNLYTSAEDEGSHIFIGDLNINGKSEIKATRAAGAEGNEDRACFDSLDEAIAWVRNSQSIPLPDKGRPDIVADKASRGAIKKLATLSAPFLLYMVTHEAGIIKLDYDNQGKREFIGSIYQSAKKNWVCKYIGTDRVGRACEKNSSAKNFRKMFLRLLGLANAKIEAEASAHNKLRWKAFYNDIEAGKPDDVFNEFVNQLEDSIIHPKPKNIFQAF